MKKAVKITLTVGICAVCLFLLLPFLETQAPSKPDPAAEKKAEPQIFTSNPLTEIVGRIARFFGTREKAKSVRNAQGHVLTDEQAAEIFGEPQHDTLYAAASGAAADGSMQTAAGAGSALNDYLQNDGEEWVLIRQEVPQGASRGMHEINVRDNAYDRFITQERQARFTPVMRIPAVKGEVPDSRIARLFNPIKRFFGFGEEPVASGAFQGTEIASAAASRTSASSAMGKNKEKSSILPKANPVDWEGFKNNPFSSLVAGGKEATKALADIIFPNSALQETAEMLANIKFPNAAHDPQQQQEKANFKLQWLQEKYQEVNAKSAEILEEKASATPENTLSAILTNSCLPETPSVKKASCAISNVEGNAQSQNQQVEEIKDLNKRRFYEKTNLNLPPAGITVVLHKTDQEIPTLEEIAQANQEDPNKPVEIPLEKQQAVAMYHYMQQQCPDCYWVATGKGTAQELQQTVEAAGLSMKGDPLNRHQQYIDGFIEEQKQKGITDDETLNQLKDLLEKNQTPYTAYTKEDLQQLYSQTFDLMLEKAQPENASVPFFVQANSAYDYYNETGRRHPMFYGNGSATNDGTLQARSAALTDEVADYINSWRPILQEIKQEAAQEGITDLAAPQVQKMLQDYLRQKKDFDANNELGKTQK